MGLKEEIKDAISQGKIVYGIRQSKKAVVRGNAKKIVVAKNCPDSAKSDFFHYSKVSGIPVEEFEDTEKQLGIFCGKPFSIAALSILK